jgi:hypothetical protein
MEEPIFNVSSTDIADPNRAKALSETAEPKLISLRTLVFDIISIRPTILALDPKRPYFLKERDDPICTKFKMDIPEPNLAKDLNDIVEPHFMN